MTYNEELTQLLTERAELDERERLKIIRSHSSGLSWEAMKADGEYQAIRNQLDAVKEKLSGFEKDFRQKRSQLPYLWSGVQIDPVPFFESLRDAVVNGYEPPKRTPKWRFKLADDFCLLVQAKDSARVLFECIAIAGEGIHADVFSESHAKHPQLRQLKIQIRLHGKKWDVKPTSCIWGAEDGFKRYKPGEEARRAEKEFIAYQVMENIKTRAIDAIARMGVDGEFPMLSEHCLICGKGLTDAVSKSRLIGPECANNYTRDGARIVTPLYIRRAESSDGEEAAI